MEGPEEEEEKVKFKISVFIAFLHHLFTVQWTSHIQQGITTCARLKFVELRTLWIIFFNHADKFNTYFIPFEK